MRRNKEREKNSTVFSMEEAVKETNAPKSNPMDSIVGKGYRNSRFEELELLYESLNQFVCKSYLTLKTLHSTTYTFYRYTY